MKVYIHILAHLPHYYPLYMAGYELSRNDEFKVKFRLHTGVDSAGLFDRASVDYRREREALHIVVSGEHETSYYDANRRVVQEFTCGSLLLVRTPLWIIVKSSEKNDAIRHISRLDRQDKKIHLPPFATTMSSEILDEFGQFNKLVLKDQSNWNPALVAGADFNYKSEADILECLNNNSLAYFSIYPPPLDSKQLLAINSRIPSSNYGFSALWILKEQATDRAILSRLSQILVATEFYIEELYDCDRDILDNNFEPMQEQIATLLKTFEPAGMSAALFDPKTVSNAGWYSDIGRMLEEFSRYRIWAYNYSFQFRKPNSINRVEDTLQERLDNSALTGFAEHCLAQYLLQTQAEVFQSRIKGQLDILMKERDALQNVTHAVTELIRLTTGSFSSREQEWDDALSDIAELYLWRVFSDSFHDVSDFNRNYPDENLFAKRLEAVNAEAQILTKVKVLVKALNSLALELPKESGLVKDRFNKLCEFLHSCIDAEPRRAIALLNAETPDALWGGIPLLIFEMKALTRKLIPGSWLIGIGGYNGRSCRQVRDFTRLLGDLEPGFPAMSRDFSFGPGKVVPTTYLGSIRVLSALRTDLLPATPATAIEYPDASISKNELRFTLKFVERRNEDFYKLFEMIYSGVSGTTGRHQTSQNLRFLREMGWRVVPVNMEQRHIAISSTGLDYIS